jgi:uncharacterized alpha/beta hydrolase family protein
MKKDKKYIKKISFVCAIIIFIIVCVVLLLNTRANKKEEIPSWEEFMQDYEGKDFEKEVTMAYIDNYQITLTKNNEYDLFMLQSIKIEKDREIKFETETQKFFPIYGFMNDKDKLYESFSSVEDFINKSLRDITGDGIPDLSFVGYSGGASCCDTSYIIELGEDDVSVLWNSESFDIDSMASLYDDNNDGIWGLKTLNQMSWVTLPVDAPFAEMYLDYDKKENKYIPNQDKMRKPKPTKLEMENIASQCTFEQVDLIVNDNIVGKKFSCNDEFRVPWSYMWKLVFSGNVGSAREFLDLIWRDNDEWESKEVFWKQFKEQVEINPYYKYLSPGLIDLDNLY